MVSPHSRATRWRRSMGRRAVALLALAAASWSVISVVAPAPSLAMNVVVATTDLPAGRVLTRSDVLLAQRPVPVHGPVLRDIDSAVGRRLATAMASGESLSSNRLVPRSVSEGLPPDLVALHVSVADPRALDLLSPGLHVSLHDLDGAEAARDVLVLSLDAVQESAGLSSLSTPGRATGLIVALPRDLAPRLFAGSASTDHGPTVHVVLDPSPR